MKRDQSGRIVNYTPDDILKESRDSGYIVKKLDVCQEIYQKAYGRNPNTNLNLRLLREAIEHYICDLDRLTVFRGMDYADAHKKAAYSIKWFAKIKPIQIANHVSQNYEMPAYDEKTARANDYYAIIVGLSELENLKVSGLPPHYAQNLAYLLHHHSVDADFLSSEMYLLDTFFKGKR